MSQPRLPRRSGFAAASLLGVIALGVASRRYVLGLPWWDKSLGDVLYAIAVYLTVLLVRPRISPGLAAAATAVFCIAIELFQLTGIPARYASVPLVRWTLGTRFAFHDLVCYGIGVGVIALLDRLAFRAGRAYN
ncbi:MAG: hypothetical protein K0Q72_2244 [Armatimonadetes bacterium]|nr:hypothetical protein [Armatimonadota bacterium]